MIFQTMLMLTKNTDMGSLKINIYRIASRIAVAELKIGDNVSHPNYPGVTWKVDRSYLYMDKSWVSVKPIDPSTNKIAPVVSCHT